MTTQLDNLYNFGGVFDKYRTNNVIDHKSGTPFLKSARSQNKLAIMISSESDVPLKPTVLAYDSVFSMINITRAIWLSTTVIRVHTMKFLTAEQKKFYDDNGYVVLDILNEAEIEELSKEYDDIFKRKADNNLEATWQGNWNTQKQKQTQVQSIHGLQMHSAAFTRLLLNPKMLDACEDIIETENILLHHTKAHTKPPGTGSPFPMHQDYHYFPFENDSMVAVFISMDAADPENGGLCVYPGSHKLGPQEDCSNAPGWHYLSQEKFPISKATPLSLKRGQIVVFSYLLVHGSYDNTSDRVRRMFLIQLMSADDTPLAKVHQSDCQRMVLRGKCVSREADIKKRHKEFTEMEKEAGM